MRRPQDKNQRRKKAKSTSVAKTIFLLSIFVIAQIIFLNSDFFKLRTVEILGSERVSNDEIIEIAGFPWGDNVLSLDIGQFSKKIEGILWIKKVKLTKIFPGGIKIAVTERNPVISVAYKGKNDKRFAVDDDGVILYSIENDTDRDLPNLLVDHEIRIGDKVDRANIGTVLKFYTWLNREMARRITALTIEKDSQISFIYLCKDHPIEVRIGGLEDVKRKMDILQKILFQMEGKSNQIEYVDLRYNEPVVRVIEKKGDETNKDKKNDSTENKAD